MIRCIPLLDVTVGVREVFVIILPIDVVEVVTTVFIKFIILTVRKAKKGKYMTALKCCIIMFANTLIFILLNSFVHLGMNGIL